MAATTNPQAVGAVMRWIRKQARMTLTEVSQAAGISATYLSNVENGNVCPRPEWVHMVLGVIGTRMLETKQ